MGRKSKKGETVTPWCYYCEQEFTNDNDLILHQKARHFKCSECGKKMATIVALKVHLSDVRLARAPALRATFLFALTLLFITPVAPRRCTRRR